MRVLIAFHSDYGNTEKMAKAIAAGIKAVQGEADIRLQQAIDTSPQDLLEADVILFGTPVHMGSMAWQLKKLIDHAAKLWMENALAGKVGGAFATGGGFGGGGGGVELTLASLHSNFLEHGMIVVGFPRDATCFADAGLQWGPYARTGNHEGMPEGISEAQLTAARAYGAHVIEIADNLLQNSR
ncbi:MAG: NAD(P)H-dependent oxidoreductase [Mariprofundaceae bacterium]